MNKKPAGSLRQTQLINTYVNMLRKLCLLTPNQWFGIHHRGAFIKGHLGTLFALETEFVPFVLVDFSPPGCFNGFKVHQVERFTDQVAFG